MSQRPKSVYQSDARRRVIRHHTTARREFGPHPTEPGLVRYRIVVGHPGRLALQISEWCATERAAWSSAAYGLAKAEGGAA